MTKIKICGITRVDDAAAAVAHGADAIGLIFAPSKRQVSLRQAKKILSVIPPTVLTMGVFVNQDSQWIKEITQQLGLDRIQFHGQEKTTALKTFPQHRVIKALHPAHRFEPPIYNPAPAAGAFLIDAYVPGQAGGTGQLANWTYAKQLKLFKKPVILSGGLHADNVQAAIKKVRPAMVDVSSGVEQSPGIKDRNKIKKFIKAVKALA